MIALASDHGGLELKEAVKALLSERGIPFEDCGTGIGMSIVANKFPHVRAALVTDTFMARMAKEHNNANILVLGGRVLNEAEAREMVSTWLDASFEGGRHQGRLDKIAVLEREIFRTVPGA